MRIKELILALCKIVNSHQMNYCNIVLKEKDLVLQFYNEVTKSGYKERPYQYTLILQAYEYLAAKEIPFDKVEVYCECSTTFILSFP